MIDDDLTLLLARSNGVPRLGIFNTYSEKKKFVPISWVEGAERTLKIKVGKNTKEYDMKMITEGVGELIKSASEAMSLNSLAWRGVHLLGDMLHIPKTAKSDADLNLIAENKKDTLWYVYTPKKGNWRVRPCFMETESEAAIIAKYADGDRPWTTPAITIENGSMPTTLRNMPFTKELIAANHSRWSEFLLPIAKGMLLGFSDWSTNSDRALGNAMWKYLPQQNYRSDEAYGAIAKAGPVFIAKLISFVRLWPMLAEAKIESVGDATKAADERSLKKRERFEITNSADRNFKITRLVDEGKIAGFAVVPDTRLPGEQDRLVTMSEDAWDRSLDACCLGGEKDPQYTSESILSAVETRDWCDRIAACLVGRTEDADDKGEGA